VKVLVVNNMAPFVWGGAEELALHLQRNLAAHGHECDVLRIPFQWEPAERIPSQMLMVRALELSGADRVVALKFPGYLIRHPHKTLWLLHQYRQAYDLFDAGRTNLPSGERGEDLRALIKGADDEAFRESRRIFTNSEVTQERLRKYNGFSADVLPPPLNDPELFTGGEPRGYIFAGGRVNALKRQHLLVEAFAQMPRSARLVVAGPPDAPGDAERLHQLVDELGLRHRVTLDLRLLTRRELADYVNHSIAVAYVPFDEDSLGYVAMEAATARKPVISARDSGGVLGLAKHGETGWIAEPHAKSLAKAMAAAYGRRAREMGRAAYEKWTALGITWSRTLETLLS
jgi:glycosyltransferase involved in cell wall biosynthesis